MTLRNNLPPEKLQAHKVLDMVKAGMHVEAWRVHYALLVLGDE